MSALENAKNMSVEDILAKTAASGLLEFGVERSVVTEKWNQVNAEREFQTNPIRVVAGLNKKLSMQKNLRQRLPDTASGSRQGSSIAEQAAAVHSTIF